MTASLTTYGQSVLQDQNYIVIVVHQSLHLTLKRHLVIGNLPVIGLLCFQLLHLQAVILRLEPELLVLRGAAESKKGRCSNR